MKKFELALETEKSFLGIKLYRIRALISFSYIKQGELGGYVAAEKNLDHYGDAWVSGDARVYGNARVSGDAQVSGDAWVSGNAQVYGNARVSKFFQSCSITNLRFSLTSLPKGIQVGCHFLSMKDWKTQYKQLAKDNNLPDDLAEAYLRLVLALRRVQRIEAHRAK